MLLENKNAIIYGAGGSLGSTVAKALALAGARVFLTGRKLHPLQQVAQDIVASGGSAQVDQVDALDEEAIQTHLQKVVDQASTVDISFNAIDLQAVQSIPLVDMTVDDFVRPVRIAMQTHFLTARAAAKVMVNQRSGVILSLTATCGGIGYPFTGGFAPACYAIESFSRNLASEVGVYGIRVVNVRSAGSPDSKVFKEALSAHPEQMESILGNMVADTMLKRLPLMADIANAIVFLASPLAGTITGVSLDVTAGTTAGLNYKVAAHPSQ